MGAHCAEIESDKIGLASRMGDNEIPLGRLESDSRLQHLVFLSLLTGSGLEILRCRLCI